MKEMTRKEFLKLTGASTALLAMSHIIPTSAYADTSKIDAPSAGMYISEVVDLSGLSPVEQEKSLPNVTSHMIRQLHMKKLLSKDLQREILIREFHIVFR